MNSEHKKDGDIFGNKLTDDIYADLDPVFKRPLDFDINEGITPEQYAFLEAREMAMTKCRAKLLPKTPEEVKKWLNTMPLFATSVDEKSEAGMALKTLQDMTTPRERADNYKHNGNTAMKLVKTQGKYRLQHAYDYYTQGIDVNCDDAKLNSILYSNRAQVSLTLENYGRSIADCKKAISFNVANVKAHYRKGQAGFKLKKYQDVVADCVNAVEQIDLHEEWMANNPVALLDPSEKKQRQGEGTLIEGNTTVTRDGAEIVEYESEEDQEEQKTLEELQQEREKEISNNKKMRVAINRLKAQAEAEVAKLRAREEKKQQRLAAKKDHDAMFDDALKRRGIVIGDSIVNLESHPGAGKIDYDAKSDRIQWPVMFLYPEYYESDYLQLVDETTCLQDHINNMFPPATPPAPWDTEGKYTADKIRVFYEVENKRNNIKKRVYVNTALPIMEVIAQKGYEIKGIPMFLLTVDKK